MPESLWGLVKEISAGFVGDWVREAEATRIQFQTV
jgi:hypothetical protein